LFRPPFRLQISLGIACLLVPSVALADPAAFGTAEIGVGGGHDSNMFLHVSPDVATREPRTAGWFGQAAPKLGAGLTAGRWRLDLEYSLDYRGSRMAGHLMVQELELAVSLPPLGWLRPTVSGVVGRFDASRFADDRFQYIGGGLELRLEVSASVRLHAGYQLELRAYPARAGERDLMHVAELRLSYRPDPRVEVGLGSSYLALAPATATAMSDGNFRLLRLGPDLQVIWGLLTVLASGWGGAIQVGPGSREWQVGGGLGTLLRLGSNVDLAATAELSAAPWAGEVARDAYGRRLFALSLIGHATGRTSLRRRPVVVGLRPVAEARGVRFRFRSADAASVELIGSWNDWTAPGTPLVQTREAGLWEVVVEIPPGAHKYRMLVDGRPVRPPDAPRYVKDDFDGEDAVLDVPAKTVAP
jgi:hypothetical protein